jgi:hypothetical protein
VSQKSLCAYTTNNKTASRLNVEAASTWEQFLTFELTSVADPGFVGPEAYTICGALVLRKYKISHESEYSLRMRKITTNLTFIKANNYRRYQQNVEKLPNFYLLIA